MIVKLLSMDKEPKERSRMKSFLARLGSLMRSGALARLNIAALLVCTTSAVCAFPASAQELPMKIRLNVNGEIATATLYDNATARDFATLLPLSLTLTDFAEVERIGDMPRKLSTTGAPAGVDPVAGDITYYAPWSNLTIFAGDNVYARGLVGLGKVDTGLSALQRHGPLKVRIERIED